MQQLVFVDDFGHFDAMETICLIRKTIKINVSYRMCRAEMNSKSMFPISFHVIHILKNTVYNHTRSSVRLYRHSGALC